MVRGMYQMVQLVKAGFGRLSNSKKQHRQLTCAKHIDRSFEVIGIHHQGDFISYRAFELS
jgi:hypothetical protein